MKTNTCQSNAQHPLYITTDHYRIVFATTGSVSSYIGPDGEEKLDTKNPGKGFFLLLNRTNVIPLCELEFLGGDILKCSSANKTQSVYISIRPREEYCHFKVVRLEGIPTNNVLTLHFEMNAGGRVKAFDTDYMTFVINNRQRENEEIEHAHHNKLVTDTVSDADVQVNFDYIWNRNECNPLGSFALYCPTDEAHEDDIILRIWSAEDMPHPKIEGEWNYARAKEWVAQWQEMFSQRHQLMLEAQSLEELYEGAECAKKAGCNEVYLFTNSWRNKGFMAVQELNWSLRSDMYPNGEADLRAYADHLWENGIRLNIHYVSGGLGQQDPGYVVDPDDRLASYGNFELVEDISDSDTTILVKPLDGVECPFLSDDCDAYLRLPALYRFFGYSFVRIGKEIIKVGAFLDTDKEVWQLTDCQRGINTVVAAHQPGETTKGLINAYPVLLPDNDSSLLDEVAENYAGLVNRCRISHTEYDGAEIHNYNGNWGFQKFTSIVYQNLDHPVTAHDSGATQPKCHIEYRLNRTTKIMEGTCSYSHGNYSIPFTLDTNSRPAANKLDAHYTLCQGYKGGAMGLAKPEPMFGVTPSMLNAHGQVDELFRILNNWREVAENLTDEQKEIIENSFRILPDRFERSKHIASDNVFVAKKDNEVLSLVPTTVLTREKDDVLWQHGQEHGPIPPKQYVKLGASLTLNNPHKKQTPKFLLRLAQHYDYQAATRSAFDFEELAGQAEGEVEMFTEGNVQDTETRTLEMDCNLLLNPRQEDFSGQSATGVTVEDGSYLFDAQNPVDHDHFEVNSLPCFHCRADMSGHRGIGLTVTGDNSGAIFMINIAGRDYVVPINFSGEKYIEILHGEVAWHDANWGWRMATKSTRYSNVTSFRTGFCYLPPKTDAKITVKDIKLLREIDVPLNELRISNSEGELRIAADINTGDYIEYEGGDTATIYDANYNTKQTVKVENNNFLARPGSDTYAFSGKEAWLEVQLTTEGDEIVIKG